MGQAQALATNLHASHLFAAYGSAYAVLSTIMAGRELGFPALASLRSFHIIEGKPSISAQAMVAKVLRSGLAEYWESVSFSETEATFETKRKGARKPERVTHTIEMARIAWPKKDDKWEEKFKASGWGRNPTDMLVARSQSRLVRLVYSDLVLGLYTPEELEDMRSDNV